MSVAEYEISSLLLLTEEEAKKAIKEVFSEIDFYYAYSIEEFNSKKKTENVLLVEKGVVVSFSLKGKEDGKD